METNNMNKEIRKQSSKEVADVYTAGPTGGEIWQVTRGDLNRVLAGKKVYLPAWVVEQIKVKHANRHPRAETASKANQPEKVN
jgi:hypothetical protein